MDAQAVLCKKTHLILLCKKQDTRGEMSIRFPSFARRAPLAIHIKLPVTNGTEREEGG